MTDQVPPIGVQPIASPSSKSSQNAPGQLPPLPPRPPAPAAPPAPPPLPALPLVPPLPALPAAPAPPLVPAAPPLPPAPPAPLGSGGGTHAPIVQMLPLAQSAVVAHVVRQLSPDDAHVYAPQGAGTTMRQVPPPLHVRAGIDVPALQLAAPHTVPLAYLRHAPLPSHAPSVPQLAAPWSAHWFSGSVPAGTSMHRPSLPETAHDRHAPPHAVAQQTPSTQKPEAQSAAAAHVAPGGFGPQLPFVHTAPPTQSAFVAQSA